MVKKELQQKNQTKFRIEKPIKKKGDKLYVMWKGYDNSLNSWIKKTIPLHKMNCYLKPDRNKR